MTDSYWLSEPAEQLPRVACGGPVDVVVIGGGVTGCSCALTLAEAGLRVRLYEARRVASGASGRNGGFALRGLAISYPAARERFGSTAAEALWRFTERSLDRMETLAGDALRRVGSLRLADDEELAAVRAEYEALRGDGLSAEWVDELGSPLAATFRGAILHPGDGSLQPARWVRRGGCPRPGGALPKRRRRGSLRERTGRTVEERGRRTVPGSRSRSRVHQQR